MNTDFEALMNGQMLRRLRDMKYESVREKLQLRQVELEILYLVSRFDSEKTEKDIARMRDISKAHVSKSIENLREKGYIIAEEGKSDRRRVYLHVTEKGRQAADSIRQVREEMTVLLYSGITEEEKAVLQRIAKKVGENIRHGLETKSNQEE